MFGQYCGIKNHWWSVCIRALLFQIYSTMGPKRKAATPQEECALMKDSQELEARIMDMEEESDLESEWRHRVQDQLGGYTVPV